jgi:hypothetical protein
MAARALPAIPPSIAGVSAQSKRKRHTNAEMQAFRQEQQEHKLERAADKARRSAEKQLQKDQLKERKLQLQQPRRSNGGRKSQFLHPALSVLSSGNRSAAATPTSQASVISNDLSLSSQPSIMFDDDDEEDDLLQELRAPVDVSETAMANAFTNNGRSMNPHDSLDDSHAIMEQWRNAPSTVTTYRTHTNTARKWLAAQIHGGKLKPEYQDAYDIISERSVQVVKTYFTYRSNLVEAATDVLGNTYRTITAKTLEGIRSSIVNHFNRILREQVRLFAYGSLSFRPINDFRSCYMLTVQ